MTFSDIKSAIYLYTKTNSTSFPVANIVILANNALERVESLILQADGRWEFDDSNQSDLPIATTTVTSGQQDYLITTNHLRITDVEIKDTDGIWRKLTPIDKNDYTEPLSVVFSQSGDPEYYDILGSSLFLYPSPDYTQAASLKLYFQRPPSYFASGDTTKQPGFNALYHDLIPLWVSYNYAIANGLKNANQLFVEIDRKERALLQDYSKRSKDDPARMTVRRIRNFR